MLDESSQSQQNNKVQQQQQKQLQLTNINNKQCEQKLIIGNGIQNYLKLLAKNGNNGQNQKKEIGQKLYGIFKYVVEKYVNFQREIVYQRFDNFQHSYIPHLNGVQLLSGIYVNIVKIMGKMQQQQIFQSDSNSPVKKEKLSVEQQIFKQFGCEEIMDAKKQELKQNKEQEFQIQNIFNILEMIEVQINQGQVNLVKENQLSQNLIFDSKFESGNLMLVQKVKSDSLFKSGQQPVVFSQKRENLGWTNQGFEIKYQKNEILKEEYIGYYYYSLSFKYECQESDDLIYFAHSFPYTYSRLNNYLDEVMEKYYEFNFIKRELLAKTLLMNNCDILTITNFEKNQQFLEDFQNKKLVDGLQKKDEKFVIFVIARQHPGETPCSYVMEGIIDFLVQQDNKMVDFLLENCIFKIIPMMNPDGVIHGNYRCNLAGQDMNRKWGGPDYNIEPTVYYAKEQLRQLSTHETLKIKLLLDLHGHSTKKGGFFYGNPERKSKNQKNKQSDKIQNFPLLCCQKDKAFSFKECEFKQQPGKENTLRETIFEDFEIEYVYTQETSFYGYQVQNGSEVISFTQQKLKDMGKAMMQALYQWIQDEQQGKSSIQNIDLNANNIGVNSNNNIQNLEKNTNQNSNNVGFVGNQGRVSYRRNSYGGQSSTNINKNNSLNNLRKNGGDKAEKENNIKQQKQKINRFSISQKQQNQLPKKSNFRQNNELSKDINQDKTQGLDDQQQIQNQNQLAQQKMFNGNNQEVDDWSQLQLKCGQQLRNKK
ncbi:hypothetical protein PPERSA_05995 [Pseudocohnilembus persalinus]|uniref:Peptidase M14 domain-containing protein n=1 Tax=Pseudocohnilembus persalinus TaxID=266149 RepID=A0A0V0Q777_PSEPJ|nr:hypothetical protein PPERSA_05995 [Pseudocohnilembus persalinus]|eukprot:KRW98099.1 hypothetical protein PPERSA_05995 [Pseudocohnilembus persalinus]